jgi:uncharacterized protein (TIGR03790 family)
MYLAIFVRRSISAACAALIAATAFAGGGPENVLLVVNPRGPKSKEVANHYIALRHIPANNVCYLPLAPNANVITGLDFREKLLKPALATIERRGLQDQIDHIVYSCDYPFQIDFTAMFPKAEPVPQLNPIASLTGATYLSSFVNKGDANLIQLNTNFYFMPMEPGPFPSRAFRHKYQWAPGGTRVDAGGVQYYLATQLGSTNPSGNTAPEIIAYLKRSAAADGTRPDGAFFYMQNADIRTTVRRPLFAAAVKEINSLGLSAEVLNGVVPANRSIAGLTTGAPKVLLRNSGSTLLPGALVDNLTSHGGMLLRLNNPKAQTRISEYLRLGAAGASGAVVEPYAIAQKFPSPALHVHYARGSTMAEAFYQSIQGPYQLLVLGDPLCQPWAAIPEVSVDDFADGDTISGTVEIKPHVTFAAGRGQGRCDLYVDGKLRESGGPFKLDTTKLADGYHELRVVVVDNTPLETQGRWIAGVTVKNGRDAVSLTTPQGSKTNAAQIELNVASTVDGETVVFHNARELGRVKGRTGKLTVPTAQLGRGPVILEARIFTKPMLSSQPLRLEIE